MKNLLLLEEIILVLQFKKITCSKEIGFGVEEIVIEEGKDDSDGSNTMFWIEKDKEEQIE